MGMWFVVRMLKLIWCSWILIMIVLGVIVLLFVGLCLIDVYVDWLWFGEFGYCLVFIIMLVICIVVCLVVGVVVGGIVFGGFVLVYCICLVFVLDVDNDLVVWYCVVVLVCLWLVGIGIFVVIGLLVGIVV